MSKWWRHPLFWPEHNGTAKWRVVTHNNRLYLLNPSGSVVRSGNYGDSWSLKDEAEKMNRHMEIEGLVRSGKL